MHSHLEKICGTYSEAALFLGVDMILDFLEELQVSPLECLDDDDIDCWLSNKNSSTFCLFISNDKLKKRRD